jgi:HEAT repeat protein
MHLRALVDAMASNNPEAQKSAAAELIKSEQFMDSITGEPVPTRVKAAEALEALGNSDAVKQCIAFLKDPDKPVRDRIIVTLQKIGGNSPDNMKELVVGLKDGDPNVRKGTISALTAANGGIGPKPGMVTAIVTIMKAEAGARGPGGDVLGSDLFIKGGANKESVPQLLVLLKDKDEGVRGGAADALGKIGDPAAIDPLKVAMHTDTAQIRRISIGAIALIADKSGEDCLTEAINNQDDDNEARAQAAAGLGKIATPTAVATLVKALDDDDLKLRSAAVAALGRAGRPVPSGPPSMQVVNALTAALQDQRDSIRIGATQALQTIAATEADPSLIAALQKDDDDVRAAAAAALGFPNNGPAVAPLIAALSDPSGNVDTAARDALAAIGEPATAELVKVIQKGGTQAYYAAQALSRVGIPALPALEKVADNPNPVGQRWAAVALGGLNSADASPTLEKLEKSTDPDVSYVAKEQLNRMRTQ